MNKYQEALDSIGSIPIDYDFVSYQAQEKGSNFVKLQFEILQELVDKAIPIKPDDYKNLGFVLYGTYVIKMKTGKCKCGHPVDLLQSHCHCGQALDWTDNE